MTLLRHRQGSNFTGEIQSYVLEEVCKVCLRNALHYDFGDSSCSRQVLIIDFKSEGWVEIYFYLTKVVYSNIFVSEKLSRQKVFINIFLFIIKIWKFCHKTPQFSVTETEEMVGINGGNLNKQIVSQVRQNFKLPNNLIWS